MKLGLGIVLFTALAAVACTSAPADDSASSDSALRALEDNEVLGEISYGETKTIDLTLTPTYRAFYFYGERGDQIQLTATSLDATDPIMWMLDADFNTIARNTDARPTDTSSLINGSYLPKTGKYYVAVRETNHAPQARFAVSLRKLGVLPADCDPNGEGTWDSSCTDPLGYDPFDAASCAGDDMTADAAKKLFGGPNGFKPARASVLYQTRQCVAKDGAAPDCSPWVYAFVMDVKLTTITAKKDAAGAVIEGAYNFASDTTRKSNIDFTASPAALTAACVDGPFAAGALSAELSDEWTPMPGTVPGVCTGGEPLHGKSSKITSTCARFELPSITLGSGEATHYTELSPVLYAKF